jgi:hypothetical protein
MGYSGYGGYGTSAFGGGYGSYGSYGRAGFGGATENRYFSINLFLSCNYLITKKV